MRKTQTVEMTSKKWKLVTLVGTLLCIVGTAMLAYGVTSENPNVGDVIGVIGFFALFVGLCTAIVARVGAWWFHG